MARKGETRGQFTPRESERESKKDQRTSERDQRTNFKHQGKFSLSLPLSLSLNRASRGYFFY